MARSLRSVMLVAGAAAVISSQAAYATAISGTVDPLVALSALGTVQSNAAVCGAATAAAAAAGTAATTQGVPGGCVLPVTGTPVAPPVATTAPVPAPPPPVAPIAAVAAAPAIGTLPLVLGLVALAGIAAAAAGGGGGKGNGNLQPVSPA